MLSFSECLVPVYVLFIYTISISFIFFSKEELSLIANRCTASTSKWFLKRKDMLESEFFISVNYSFSVIQIAAVSTWQVVLMYIYMGVLVYWPLSVKCVFVCMCVFVCVISNQSTSKKPYYVSVLSKPDTLFHKTHSKVLLVLRYKGLTCIDP